MPNYQKTEAFFKKENVPYDRFKTGDQMSALFRAGKKPSNRRVLSAWNAKGCRCDIFRFHATTRV
jgi:hypothetical protein